MQNQSCPQQEMAKIMFKRIIEAQQIMNYTTLPPQRIKLLCQECGRLFHRKLLKKPNQTLAFLSNYHQIIQKYPVKNTSVVNNLSLHFILLSSYAMVMRGEKQSAKQLLKKSVNYIDSTDPDPILLVNALNNLCIIRMQQRKYYKSINTILPAIRIIEGHIKSLKQKKLKNKIMEDSVFLVNSYYLFSKCMSKIKVKSHNPSLQEWYRYCTQKGIRVAEKYLGKDSFLTLQFIQLKNNNTRISLPIYRQDQEDETLLEEKLLKKLNQIQSLIKTQNREPIIIHEKIEKIQPLPPPPPPPVDPPLKNQNQDLICQSIRTINDWTIQIKILREKGQKLGNIVLSCRKGKDFLNLIISEAKIFKLWTQMNLADVLPQQCTVSNLSPEEIIHYCIFNFLYVDDNKNIQIFPRSNSFLTSFMLQIFKKDCIVFLYHIRDRNFRLAIGGKYQAITTHLQLELNEQFIETMFQYQQQTDQRIYQIYKKLMAQQKKVNNMSYIQEKLMNVRNEQKLIKCLEGILRKFENFLKGLKTDVQLHQILKQQFQFYKFVQNSKDYNEGKFYYIRYLINIKGFEVNIENTFETHGPHGKLKAKGQILYSFFQFYRDFGIPSEIAANRFRVFSHILSKKYDIKMYENPLTSRDIQIYQQNCISELKITFKTFLRKMRHHKSSIFPLTACVISINNEIPVGIKLTCYNPNTCFEVGFFIYIYDEAWKWPEKPQSPPQDFINKVLEQYGYRKQYFLVDWLEKQGFQKIIQLLEIDQKDCFSVDGTGGNFFRVANILDMCKKK